MLPLPMNPIVVMPSPVTWDRRPPGAGTRTRPGPGGPPPPPPPPPPPGPGRAVRPAAACPRAPGSTVPVSRHRLGQRGRATGGHYLGGTPQPPSQATRRISGVTAAQACRGAP
ncbi:hypothetical protein GCM10009679_57540 [Saccharothrix algeriensis]